MTYYPATTADFVSNATASSKESVTDVQVPCPASRVVEFEFRGVFTVAATTTGVGFGLDIPASATIVAVAEITISTAAGTDETYISMITSDDATPDFPADVAATAGNRFKIHGRVVNSTTDGTIQLRVDTDTTAAATIKKGVTRWGWDACAA